VGDGPEREALEAVGAEVTGAVPHAQVPGLLAEASIGLVPYAADTPDYFSPLKLFEYLAAGLAVVAGSIPGVREVVGAEHAVLIPPGDPAALAAAVAELAGDRSRRARLGRAGRELVAARHTWEARARRILELAEELARTEVSA
jgi:glycosyltransferase involved in cell wall biosynthesis